MNILVGDEAANSNDSDWGMDCSTVVRVKTLHISSPILAAKSPFFYKVIVLWFYLFLFICSLSSVDGFSHCPPFVLLCSSFQMG